MAREVKYPNFVGVSLDDVMFEKLKKVSQDEERTVSQQIRYIINKIFKMEEK
jgi:hypothetical protein